MAIEIRERFCVEAPIDSVWQFVKDPRQVVTCMPGASLDEVVDARTYRGTVKVKLGAVTTRYKGRVELAEVDDTSYTVRLVAEGQETSGGTARGTLSSHLSRLDNGQTEVVAEGDIDLTGRVVQVGRGMIRGVSHQLFQEFAASTKVRLEAAAQGGDPGSAPVTSGTVPPEPEALRILPILARALRDALVRFVRKLVKALGRRGSSTRPPAGHDSSER